MPIFENTKILQKLFTFWLGLHGRGKLYAELIKLLQAKTSEFFEKDLEIEKA